MVINLNDGTKLALGTKTGLLTRISDTGLRQRVTSAAQLRELLASVNREDAAVWLAHAGAWCEIALDRDSSVGIKATRQTRNKWQTSARLIAGALALGERKEAA